MSLYEAFDREIQNIGNVRVLCEELMSQHTSFHIGGAAARMVFPKDERELAAVCDLCSELSLRSFVLGNGTNILVDDKGIDGVVISTDEMKQIKKVNSDTLLAQSGASLAKIAVFAQTEGLSGFEFAHGIPGSLGGAVVMNAGAYDGEMKQVVTSVTAWYPTGIKTICGEDLQFAYRHSVFSDAPEAVVLSAEIRLHNGDCGEIKAKMEELMARRKKSQPLEYPSAGSTFKRPVGYFAGTLIEQCGLKGATVGGAQVSEKHAGFVINKGGATCADVLGVIKLVQDTVFEKQGVKLEPEVRIIK